MRPPLLRRLRNGQVLVVFLWPVEMEEVEAGCGHVHLQPAPGQHTPQLVCMGVILLGILVQVITNRRKQTRPLLRLDAVPFLL